jgi:hypothetical protein
MLDVLAALEGKAEDARNDALEAGQVRCPRSAALRTAAVDSFSP